MKNFKKLFASIATIAILATAVPTAVLGVAQGYDAELEDAYNYAYENGITTQSSIDNADMYGTLYRIHMAKMMSNYATEVLGKTPDTSVDCNFKDIGGQSSELQAYAEEACQLGIMGINPDGTPADYFNPMGVVTRAQFGTVLSGALYGDVNNGGDPYYQAHLEALQAAGIMTKIDTPNAVEKRGRVMLMMMRADPNAGTPAICDTTENQVYCSINSPLCPAECQNVEPDEEKAGNLSVSLVDQLADGTSVPKVGTITLASLKFSASSSDVTLRSVDLEKTGLGARAGLYRVFFEKDGMRVSGKASFTTDGKATISLSPSLVIKAGSYETLDFVVMLSGTDNGNEYAFNFTAVDSSAENADVDLTTNMVRTAGYSVNTVTLDPLGTATTYKAGEAANAELAKFKITNNDAANEERTVNFKAITLRQEGDADLNNAENRKLYKDSTKISSSYVINGKDITFIVDADILPDQSNTFYVRADVTTVENTAGDNYTFYVRNTEDLNVIEKSTNFRTTVTNNYTSTANINYLVEGGDVTFTKDTALSTSQNVAPATTDALLMKGTITTKEPITLEDATLYLKIANPTQIVNKFTLKIGNSSSTWTPTGTGNRLTGTFDGSRTINSSATVYLYADVKSTATGGIIALMQNFDLSSFDIKEYVASQNTVAGSVGSIAGSILTVKAPSLYLTRTDGLSARSIVKGSNNVTLFEGKFGTNENQDINVTSFTFSGAGDIASFSGMLSTTLYVDGNPVSSKTFRDGKMDFAGLNIGVTNGDEAIIKLIGNFNSSIETGKNLTLTLKNVSATDENSQTVTVSSVDAAAITTSDAGSVAIVKSSSATPASLLVAWTNDVEVAKFSVTASNDNAKMTDVYFINSGTMDLSLRMNSPKLYKADGTTKVADGALVGTAIVFKNIAGVVIDPTTSQSFVVKANLNSVLNTGDLQNNTIALKLGTGAYDSVTPGTLSGVRFVSDSNGNDITAITTADGVMSDTHRVVRSAPLLTLNTTTPDTNRLMNFKITAQGNKVTLTGLDLQLNNISGTQATALVNIYKNSVSSANRIGSGKWATRSNNVASYVVTLTTNTDIDAGSSMDFIIEMDGYVPALNGTTSLTRGFKITDLSYLDNFQNGTLYLDTIASYTNMNLPLSAPNYTP